MKLLVFLQNAWKHGAAEGQTKWWPGATREESRRAWETALWRSQSGKRLVEMLPEVCETVIANVSPFIAPTAGTHYSMDESHVISQVLFHQPDVVLLLGKEARKAAAVIVTAHDRRRGPSAIRIVVGPHPAWRLLSKAHTAEIRKELEEYPKSQEA